jgi:hypothetical protein
MLILCSQCELAKQPFTSTPQAKKQALVTYAAVRRIGTLRHTFPASGHILFYFNMIAIPRQD